MAKVTIERIEKFNKIGVAHLHGGTRCTFWLGDAFADQLTDGAEVEMKTEEKPNRQNPDKMDRWITEVNGQGAKKSFGGGGGGGFKGAPKDDDSIAVQVILKEAFESARMNATHEKRLLDLNEVRLILLAGVELFHDAYNKMKVKP